MVRRTIAWTLMVVGCSSLAPDGDRYDGGSAADVDVAPLDAAPLDAAPPDAAPPDAAPPDAAPLDAAPLDAAPLDVAADRGAAPDAVGDLLRPGDVTPDTGESGAAPECTNDGNCSTGSRRCCEGVCRECCTSADCTHGNMRTCCAGSCARQCG